MMLTTTICFFQMAFVSQLTPEDRILISRLEVMAAAADAFLLDRNDDDPASAPLQTLNSRTVLY